MFSLGFTITAGSSLFFSPLINCVYVLGWYSTFRSLVSTLTLGAVKPFPMLNILYSTRGFVLNYFFDIKCIEFFSGHVRNSQNNNTCHRVLLYFHVHIYYHHYTHCS